MASDVTPFPKTVQVSTYYARVRDAAVGIEDISVAEQVATLELVKYELLRDAQDQIDRG